MKEKIESIKFRIKEELERHNIIVHRNINEPSALFLGENGDTVVVGVISLLLPIDSYWNEEAISEYIKEFFDNRGIRIFPSILLNLLKDVRKRAENLLKD